MDTFDKKTINTLTELSRIRCSEEEQLSLLEDLKKIVAYIDTLNEIDTSNVAPCLQVVPAEGNVFREDDVKDILPRELFLSNVPAQIGGLVRVPLVMKQK